MSFLSINGLKRLWANIRLHLDSKVDKVEGKQLSSNDFTDDYKNKVDSLDITEIIINANLDD